MNKLKRYIKPILGWSAVLLLLVFILLNRRPVDVDFGLFEVRGMPVALVVLLSALLGGAAVYAFQFLRKRPPQP